MEFKLSELFEKTETLISNHDFIQLDELLQKTNHDLAVATLRGTYRVRKKLKYWDILLLKTKVQLLKDNKQADRILRGLLYD